MLVKNVLTLIGLVLLAVVLSACGGKEDRLTKHFDRGVQHLADGDYEKARVEFKNVLQMEPKHVAALYNMGQSFEKLDDLRSAVSFYQRTLEIEPTHFDAKTRLARLFVTGGAPQLAAPLADELLAVRPTDSAALAVRAAVRAQKGEKEAAEHDARAALMADPGNLDATFLLASILAKTDRADESVSLLNRAAQSNPKAIAVRVALADIYHTSGRRDEAGATLGELIALEPDNIEHRIRLARYYASENKLDEAEKVLRDAVASQPSASDAKLALVEFLAQRRDSAAARKQLDEFVAADPGNAELKFAQARLAQAENDNAAVVSIYRDIIGKNGTKPNGLKARTELARFHLSKGQTTDVAPLINQVLKENAKDREALLIRADLAMQNKDATSAIADYRAVLREDATLIPVHKSLARAHLLNNEPELAKDSLKNALKLNDKDADARLQLGMLYRSEGSIADAIAELEQVLNAAPDNPVVLETLFKTYIAAEEWSKAEGVINTVRQLAPDSGAAEFYGGMLALAQGDNDKAASAMAAALAKRPAWNEALIALVGAHVKQKQQDKALAAIDAALKADPNDAGAHNLRGEVLLSLGNEKASQAAASFAKAVELQSTFGTAYRNWAVAELAAGNMQKAEEVYQKGISATEGSLTLYLALASLYERQERFDEAIAVYNSALPQHAESESVANNLAMLLAAHRGDQVSLERAKQLVEPLRASTNPAVLDTVGWVDYKLGNYAAAVPSLELALKTVPTSPLLQYHLGMAHAKQGNTAQAKENLAKALASETKFHGREEAEAMLAQLEAANG